MHMWLIQFSPQHYTGDARGEGGLRWHSQSVQSVGVGRTVWLWTGLGGNHLQQLVLVWKTCIQQVTVLLFLFHSNTGDKFRVGGFFKSCLTFLQM